MYALLVMGIYFPFAENSDGAVISPLHDVPLRPSDIPDVFNLVVEVPRWTNAKMEVGYMYRHWYP